MNSMLKNAVKGRGGLRICLLSLKISVYTVLMLLIKKEKVKQKHQGAQEVPEVSYTVLTSTYLAATAMFLVCVSMMKLLHPS